LDFLLIPSIYLIMTKPVSICNARISFIFPIACHVLLTAWIRSMCNCRAPEVTVSSLLLGLPFWVERGRSEQNIQSLGESRENPHIIAPTPYSGVYSVITRLNTYTSHMFHHLVSRHDERLMPWSFAFYDADHICAGSDLNKRPFICQLGRS